MTIEEYCKWHNCPNMKILGERDNIRYWVSDYDDPEMYRGYPIVIIENIANNDFYPCDPERVFDILKIFEN